MHTFSVVKNLKTLTHKSKTSHNLATSNVCPRTSDILRQVPKEGNPIGANFRSHQVAMRQWRENQRSVACKVPRLRS